MSYQAGKVKSIPTPPHYVDVKWRVNNTTVNTTTADGTMVVDGVVHKWEYRESYDPEGGNFLRLYAPIPKEEQKTRHQKKWGTKRVQLFNRDDRKAIWAAVKDAVDNDEYAPSDEQSKKH